MTTPQISFRCSECGKSLKVSKETAGQKVKCPRCGKVAPAPLNQSAIADEIERPTSRMVYVGLITLVFVIVLVVVFMFRAQRPATQSFLNITLGNCAVPGVDEAGFYGDEHDDKGPFRWTNGEGRLVIPLSKNDAPQALFVQLEKPQNRFLRIRVNNREFVNEPANEKAPRKWEQTFDLSGMDLGESLNLEIESNTSTPQNDPRAIGVQVRAIKLLRVEN